MKLTKTLLQATDLPKEVLMEAIYAQIKKRGYGVFGTQQNAVEFNTHSGAVRGRSEYFSLLNKGKFEILSDGDSNVLKFEYCAIALSEYLFVLFIIIACIIWGIITHIFFVLVGIALFLLHLAAKYYNLKAIAHEMFFDVLNTND